MSEKTNAGLVYRRWYSWLWFRFTARNKFFPVVSYKGFLKRAKRRTWRYNRGPSQ